MCVTHWYAKDSAGQHTTPKMSLLCIIMFVVMNVSASNSSTEVAETPCEFLLAYSTFQAPLNDPI